MSARSPGSACSRARTWIVLPTSGLFALAHAAFDLAALVIIYYGVQREVAQFFFRWRVPAAASGA